MKNNPILMKIFAALGSALILLPILFTIITGIAGTISSKSLRLDYLMPAELFPAVIIGTILLFIVALKIRKFQRLIGFAALAMVFFLFGGQGIAVASGLASGEIPNTGFYWILVISFIAAYDFIVLGLCIVSLLIVKQVFKKTSLCQ